MTLKIANRKISLIATFIVLIALLILLNLGNWQLERANEKSALLAQMEDRKSMTPISLDDLAVQEDVQYFHIKASGYWDNQHYLLLDNRILKGQPGFEVIQPLRIDHRTILVNRGWIPWPRSRDILPEIPVITGPVHVTGIAYQAQEAIVLVEDQLNSDGQWPKIIQSLDMPKLIQLYDSLDLSVAPWVMRQDPDANAFYQRQWHYVSMPPERHRSYAVTWFGLAIALIIIYIAALVRSKENHVVKRRPEEK